jgi:uncharacterized RDD family membrane protein YckC
VATQDEDAVPGSPVADPTFEPPSLARRFGALVVDWVLCLSASSFFGDPRRDGWPPVVMLIVEYGFFVGLFAQTPGMWVTRLRCVSYIDGGRIGVIRALLRGLLLSLVLPPLIMDDQRRGLHDRVVNSIVVPAPRTGSRGTGRDGRAA